jgi:hypothetical protein
VGRTIAYCRVSSRDQNPQLQLDALDAHGYGVLFAEKQSGKRGAERPEFTAALAALRTGVTLVFWKSDRWGRSAGHVLGTIGELRDRGVTVRSLTENFDLSAREGRFMFAVLAPPPNMSWSCAPSARPRASRTPAAARPTGRCCPARSASAGPAPSARPSWPSCSG